MRAIAAIVVKDLRRFVADRPGAVLTLTMPVVLAALLGFFFAPPPLSVPVRLAVVDEDGTPATRAFVTALRAEPALSVEERSAAEAQVAVEAGTLPAALVLPPGAGTAFGLGAALAAAQRPATLLFDPSQKAEAESAAGLVQKAAIMTALAQVSDPAALSGIFRDLALFARVAPLPGSRDRWVAFAEAGSALAADLASALPAGSYSGLRLGLALERRPLVAAGPLQGYNSYAHTFAGMLCMFLLFWGLEAAKELVAERANGTLVRLRLAPIARRSILTGRWLSASFVALLISVAVYAFGMVAFGIEVLGSWLAFAAMLAALSLFAGSFALLLAGLARTERQIASVGTFVVVVVSFLGGAWLPTFLMPTWVQSASRALPTFWATDGLAAATWRGLDAAAILGPAGVLVLFALACAAIGVRAFRWS